jgi:hypothetical protein
MIHDILMITYNRAEYTRLALTRLLETCDASMRVWVWHNGAHRETLDVVREMTGHPQFHHLEVSRENKRLREPTNWFWANSTGEFISKVDDDCLEPDGWGATLRAAHAASPRLGVIGTWRFYDEDFVPELANRKIRPLGDAHQLMANCWVQGSGYVMKRGCLDELGLLGDSESFPGYCIRAALRGWQVGWAFPLLHEEHMDDPRSPFCAITTDAEFMRQRPLSAIHDNVTSLAEWGARIKHMARVVQAADPDPRRHVGWRKRLEHLTRRASKLVGRHEPWRTR